MTRRSSAIGPCSLCSPPSRAVRSSHAVERIHAADLIERIRFPSAEEGSGWRRSAMGQGFAIARGFMNDRPVVVVAWRPVVRRVGRRASAKLTVWAVQTLSAACGVPSGT